MFEGPLDLLLHLIEQEELDITTVSLALVADQFLAHLALLREVRAASLAEFLVIAAKLLVIKSRALFPPPEDKAGEDEEEEEDLGEELARQLLEYKRFKEAAGELKKIEERGLRAYPRLAPPPHIEPRLVPGSASPSELLAALKRVLEEHPPAPPVDDMVSPVVVHLAECIERIEALLREQGRLPLSRVLRRARSRIEVIVNFLAVLEMIKQQRLRASQPSLFGEIYLEPRQPPPPTELGLAEVDWTASD